MSRVLIVDDSAVDRKLAQGLLAAHGNLQLSFAADGVEALQAIERQSPEIVVTDLQMPRIDGLELTQHIRKQHPLIPVILMTAQGSEEIAVAALAAGAASYVPKRRLASDLLETVENVLSVARAQRHHVRLMACVEQSQWRFVLDNDPSLVRSMVDHVQQTITHMGLCDETGRIRIGIALEEALLNSLYHGNLEINSQLRENDSQAYYRLADERRKLAPYRERVIEVDVRMDRCEACYVVRDQGPGFDPSSLPDPTDPANLERVSGRGLLLIRTFMDEVRHNERGNEITLVKRRDSQHNSTGNGPTSNGPAGNKTSNR